MDHDRLDEIAKLASTDLTRRSALRLLVGGAAGAVISGLGLRSTQAAPPGQPPGRGDTPPGGGPPHGGNPPQGGSPTHVSAPPFARDCCPEDFPRLCGLTCVDTASDPLNCGECGQNCTGNQTCEAGVCVGDPCPPGETLCRDVCVNLDVDAGNCGICGAECAAGETCVNGECVVDGVVCDSHLTDCNGVCVDLMTDIHNCGACAHACQPSGPCASTVCSSGSCQQEFLTAGTPCSTFENESGTCDGDGTCIPTIQECQPGDTETCGVGACEVTVECQDGTMPPCTPGEPQAETCNGLDDDCDGQVDNVDPGALIHLGFCGACFMTCAAGESCIDGECVS